MSRVRILDLFCGAGGISMGLWKAGFEPFGIDIAPQPDYPFDFLQSPFETLPLSFYSDFAAVFASPPCQAYSNLWKQNKARHGDSVPDRPRLIAPVRKTLRATGLHYCIENIPHAAHRLRNPVMLCGTMFPPLRVTRHRFFETTFPVGPLPPHCNPRPIHHTDDKRRKHYGRTDGRTDFLTVTRGSAGSIEEKRDAMGTPWMRWEDINEAIPPAYSRFLGKALAKALDEGTPPTYS